MAEPLFSFSTGVLTEHSMIATGHTVTRMAWEDVPDGSGKRRPGDKPETDELGRHANVVDVLMPLGRDGQPVVVGVTVWGPAHEVPQVPALAPVEFDGLRVTVRAHRSGKGVDVNYAADGVRPAGVPARGRRAEGEAA